jgi:hypothetical protein
MANTLSSAKIAFALAPLPPPPLKATAGSAVYPDPPDVTVIAVTNSAVNFASAVAFSPATNLAQHTAINQQAINGILIE